MTGAHWRGPAALGLSTDFAALANDPAAAGVIAEHLTGRGGGRELSAELGAIPGGCGCRWLYFSPEGEAEPFVLAADGDVKTIVVCNRAAEDGSADKAGNRPEPRWMHSLVNAHSL